MDCYTIDQIKKALIDTWVTEGDLNFCFDEDGKWLIDDFEIFVNNLHNQQFQPTKRG